ncbi:MAG TPA: hypothetical protein VLI04_08775, partial [Nocardioidaceae bacterium]|nr:hypothetical protein [Nocardioidaceae bacterium]
MSTPPPPRRRRIAGERRRPQDGVEETVTPLGETPVPAPQPPTAPAAAPPAAPPALPAATVPSDFPPWRFVAALVAALALVTTALVLGLVTWDYREVQEQDRIEAVQDDAAAAAERAAAAVLSYQHDSLDADLQAAARFLSDTSIDGEPGFRSTYTEAFDANVRPLAAETKATVTA